MWILLLWIFSLFLDGFLSNCLATVVSPFSYCLPLFSLVILLVSYPFFEKRRNLYLGFSFLLGFLYDLSYTNLFLWNAIIFFAVAFLISLFYQKVPINYSTLMLFIFSLVLIYEGFNVFLLFIYRLHIPSFFLLWQYFLSHLLSNLLYGYFLFFLLQKRNKRKNKMSLLIK